MKFRKGYIYVFLVVVAFIIFSYLNFVSEAVLYDDVYSLFMARSSYSDILSITASDVHPPLYYWGLKIFTSIFGHSVFIAREFSTLGVIATLLLGCFPIRKLFGNKVAIFFILLVIIFPVSQYLANEVRMYSWTMFFVTACALLAYKAYYDNKKEYWIMFLITAICAAYMHNYGLLSISGIFFILLFIAIKHKKHWKPVLIIGFIFSLVYLPWLIQLINQIGSVSQDYWIKDLTINDIYLHLYYFYSPKEIWLPFTLFSKTQMMIGLIPIMAIQLYITITVLLRAYREKGKYLNNILLAFLAFFIPVFIGGLVSVTYMPVLVTRYMTCSFGLFALGSAFVFAKAWDRYKWIVSIFMIMLFADACIRFYSGLQFQQENKIVNDRIRDFATDDNSQNTTFIVNDFSYHVMPRLQIIAPGNHYEVLVSNTISQIDFRPFTFEQVRSLPKTNFILVHQEREAIQKDFRQFAKALSGEYVITDSLHAADIYLYKVSPILE